MIRRRSYRCPVPASWVKILIPMITISGGPIFTTAGIGLASMTLLCFSDSGLTLEPPPFVEAHPALPLQAQIPLSGGKMSQQVLFVNPAVGNELTGNGSESTPFKTITQALLVAQPNTAIVLSTGTYSTSSGETFPLKLKQGVSIQGDARTRGSNIVIQGGGTFLSPTFARQNITILGANGASLAGVTVTNRNPRGYGLWIESSSLTVIDNTFTENSHDGISIAGNSAPNIRSNYFYQNGANGITIYGTSRPEVRENVFEKTGFGINIAQKAAPILVGNRITQNRSGIVTQAYARPVLRGNVIEGNTEDGLVAIATSQPDLGTKTEPGGNVFRQNGRYDINSSASSQVIPAFGNQLTSARTSGNVDLAGTVSPVATDANKPRSPSNSERARTLQSTSTNNEAKLQPEPTDLSQSASVETRTVTTMSSIEIPVPAPASIANLPPTPSSPLQKLPLASGSDTAIETPIPPTASNSVAPPPPQTGSLPALPVLQPAPLVVSQLLPVPNGNIPIGNSRKLPKIAVPRSRTPSAGSPPLPPTRATSLGLRYRVVVEAENASKQAFVRSLVPGAFRTFSNGRVFMQVGAFTNQAKADEMLQMVTSKGLRAAIEQMN